MKWYEIKTRAKASGEKSAEVFIYGDIGESWMGETVAAKDFVKEIAALEVSAMTVRLNSYGGSVTDGLAIHNALKRHKARVTVAIDGAAYSIASLIAMAGDEIHMASNAMLMIHAPWGGAIGNSAELRDYADVLDKMAGAMATTYAARTGQPLDDMLALLTDGLDHWYDAEEALAHGFVTHITDALALAASANRFTDPALRRAVNPPAVAAAVTPPEKETKMPDLNIPTPAAAPDIAALTAQAAADYQARAKALMDTGRAYAAHGGIDLAAQAVAEGWSEADLNAKLLAAVAKGPAHASYGQGARAEDNVDRKTLGFKTMGEFAFHVRNAALGNGRLDPRLKAAATTYGNESVGPDGGFAVPPQFASEIAALALEEQSLLSLADAMPVSGNSMSFPRDESTPWGSTGVIATWDGEGDTANQRKPVLGLDTLRLKKLRVLVPASDELLADSVAMTAHLVRKMGEAVLWKTNDAIINGTGAGQPLGILNAGSLVAQAKEGSQAADTIVAANIAKMYGRCIQGAGSNLVWIMNPDAFQQIVQLSVNAGVNWMGPNASLQGAPNGTLMGRPIVLSDACDTVGDQGDIILANMAGYRAITKAGGEEFSESMHLWFDQDVTAFKLVFRMDGQPALSAAVTPPNSSITRSHFVALAARA